MRIAVDWRSASKDQYSKFCKKNPHIKLTINEWRNILYGFNESFKNYILETGDKARLPSGFGEFSINKKIRKKRTNPRPGDGKTFMNLPIDWKRSKEKGKKIYIMNFHSEGYSFSWMWFKDSARLQMTNMWYFKPSRVTSRLLAHYIKTDNKYQHLYKIWKI